MAPMAVMTKAKRSTLATARKTVDLKKRFTSTTALSLDFYLLSKPLMNLLTCNDPEVKTEDEYLKKAKELTRELSTLVKRLESLA